MDAIRAQMLLMKCDGDEIWSLDLCRQRQIPEPWIEELICAYESGFDRDSNSIYVDGKLTNQYQGISDLRLAYKLAEYLGVDWKAATQIAVSRQAQVKAIQEAFEEM